MSIKQRIVNLSYSHKLTASLLQYYLEWRKEGRIHGMERDRAKEAAFWLEKIEETASCPDNAYIPRAKGAGTIDGEGNITMHNALKVAHNSYANFHMQRLFEVNKGVHEPQEERVFQEVLRFLPAGSRMMELGANWSFYSMWFMKAIPDAQCLMVEPNPLFLNCGRLNFQLNGLRGTFVEAFIDRQSRTIPYGASFVTVDELIKQQDILHLDILHCDIQGAEYDMLLGAREALERRLVDYVFISTHSNLLHQKCIEELAGRDYKILVKHDLDESYSMDGLIVARRAEIAGLDGCHISKKSRGKVSRNTGGSTNP